MPRLRPEIHIAPWFEAPDGLLLPSSLRNEAPTRLPPDLPEELRPIPRPVAFHEPSNASVQIHSFLTEDVLGAVPSTLQRVEDLAAELAFEPALEALSIVAAKVVGIDSSLEEQEKIANILVGDQPRLFNLVLRRLREHPGMHVVAEQNLFGLMQLLIDFARPSRVGERLSPQEARMLSSGVIRAAMIADAGTKDLADEFSGEEWLPYLIQLSALYAEPSMMEEVARGEMLLEISRSEEARGFNSFCPIEDWYRDEIGLSAAEQSRLMMAFSAGTQALDQEAVKTRIRAESVENLVHSAGLTEKQEQAIALISATREEFRMSFASHGEGPRRLAWELRPFKKRPFLRCENGDLILLSPRFLVSWLTEGFHFRALDVAQSKGKGGRLNTFAGELYERYCVNLSRSVHKGLPGVEVHGDMSYRRGGGKTCDVLVDYASDLVLVEATNSRFRAQTLVSGDGADAHDDLERVLVGKCRQLNRCIDRILNGDASIPRDLSLVRSIWPIVVSMGAPVQTPPLWDHLRSALPRAFGQPRVKPLTILTPDEYEILCALVEAGSPLPELLARKTAPSYRDLDLRAWLVDDPKAPRLRRRASMMESAFEDAAKRMVGEMNLRS